MSALRIKRSELGRPVVALDPAMTVTEDSDESGIIVVARGPHQVSTCALAECPGHGYVLEDLSIKAMPNEVARIAVDALDRWNATRIVAERNAGGEWIGAVVKARRATIGYEVVWASKGKDIRAQPAAALYEQGRIHHLGEFPVLEDQLTTWSPENKNSPDRLDALVWGLTGLHLIGRPPAFIFEDDTLTTTALDGRELYVDRGFYAVKPEDAGPIEPVLENGTRRGATKESPWRQG